MNILSTPIIISSHRKYINSREQMDLMKTMNIPVNDLESYCANSYIDVKCN